jgi:hypothetical protein
MAITKVSGGVIADSAVAGNQLASGAVEQYFADTGYNTQFRNRIINGDMRIAQRGTGAVSSSGSFPVDRFWYAVTGADQLVFTGQQSTTVPAGFINSILTTVTTAETSWESGELFGIRQYIEGTNVADLGWGTANAKTVTLSFWTRSSLTGTFGGALRNNAANRTYAFEYTILSADTWEYKTVTIPGDTSGTWLTDTGAGIQLFFCLGAGSDRLISAGSWQSATAIGATGQVLLGSTLNATWYITGVQLEVGSVATPFERRPFGTELALCQRYYYRIRAGGAGQYFGNGNNQSTVAGIFIINYPVTMRTAPTALEQSGTAGDYSIRHQSTNTTCSAVPAHDTATTALGIVAFTVSSGLTAGNGSFARPVNSSAYLGWSAEL